MSTMPFPQMAYLALVILCFASVMLTLAWGVWYTRDRRPAMRRVQPDEAAEAPPTLRRAA
jgi:hypothetical protein